VQEVPLHVAAAACKGRGDVGGSAAFGLLAPKITLRGSAPETPGTNAISFSVRGGRYAHLCTLGPPPDERVANDRVSRIRTASNAEHP